MLPPALEVGWEFEQSQPTINTYKTSSPVLGPPATNSWTTEQKMRAWKIRVKLRGRGSVKIDSKFNINKLFYNNFRFQLDEVIAFLFGDIFVIYKLADVTKTTTSSPSDQYSWDDFNICYAAGYNYQDISMRTEI